MSRGRSHQCWFHYCPVVPVPHLENTAPPHLFLLGWCRFSHWAKSLFGSEGYFEDCNMFAWLIRGFNLTVQCMLAFEVATVQLVSWTHLYIQINFTQNILIDKYTFHKLIFSAPKYTFQDTKLLYRNSPVNFIKESLNAC